MKDYDIIFLGYPIWFGTYALPMKTFIKYNSLAGKTLVPFCTFGSGGLASSLADLAKDQPMATVKIRRAYSEGKSGCKRGGTFPYRKWI